MTNGIRLITTALLPLLSFASICNAQTKKTKELTKEESKQLAVLMYQFDQSKRPVGERARLAEQVLKLGEPGASALLKSVDKKLKWDVPRYNKSYERVLAKVFRRRLSKDALKIQKHRRAIQNLSKKKTLAKDEIVRTSDPALKELREFLIVTPESVIESDTYLAADRKRIELYYKCQTVARSVFKKEPLDTWKQIQADEKRLAAEALYLEGKKWDRVLDYNLKLKSKLPEKEFIGIQDLNVLRMLVGLNPLKADPKLCNAGRDHSKDMHTLKFFAHDSPVKGKKKFSDRAKKAGTSARSENIFMGRTDPLSANRAWWHSPGHHRNMLMADHEYVGLGNHLRYWTQMFR